MLLLPVQLKVLKLGLTLFDEMFKFKKATIVLFLFSDKFQIAKISSGVFANNSYLLYSSASLHALTVLAFGFSTFFFFFDNNGPVTKQNILNAYRGPCGNRLLIDKIG